MFLFHVEQTVLFRQTVLTGQHPIRYIVFPKEKHKILCLKG